MGEKEGEKKVLVGEFCRLGAMGIFTSCLSLQKSGCNTQPAPQHTFLSVSPPPTRGEVDHFAKCEALIVPV